MEPTKKTPSRILYDWLTLKEKRDAALSTATVADQEMRLLAHQLAPFAPVYGRKEVLVDSPGQTHLVTIEQEIAGGVATVLVRARPIDSATWLEWPADVAKAEELPEPDPYLTNADEAMEDAAAAWNFRTAAEVEEWAADDVVTLADPEEVNRAILTNNGVVFRYGHVDMRGDDF